jgi:hypothetical protein
MSVERKIALVVALFGAAAVVGMLVSLPAAKRPKQAEREEAEAVLQCQAVVRKQLPDVEVLAYGRPFLNSAAPYPPARGFPVSSFVTVRRGGGDTVTIPYLCRAVYRGPVLEDSASWDIISLQVGWPYARRGGKSAE